MKKLILIATILGLFAIGVQAQLGSPQTLLSFTGQGTNNTPVGTNFFSISGTNDALGYTNAIKFIDVSKVKEVALALTLASSRVDATNQVRVVTYWSFGGTNVETAKRFNWQVTAGAGPTITATNYLNVDAPFLGIQVENTVLNAGAFTNLVLQWYGKP